jgi:hypothetical protein
MRAADYADAECTVRLVGAERDACKPRYAYAAFNESGCNGVQYFEIGPEHTGPRYQAYINQTSGSPQRVCEENRLDVPASTVFYETGALVLPEVLAELHLTQAP